MGASGRPAAHSRSARVGLAISRRRGQGEHHSELKRLVHRKPRPASRGFFVLASLNYGPRSYLLLMRWGGIPVSQDGRHFRRAHRVADPLGHVCDTHVPTPTSGECQARNGQRPSHRRFSRGIKGREGELSPHSTEWDVRPVFGHEFLLKRLGSFHQGRPMHTGGGCFRIWSQVRTSASP